MTTDDADKRLNATISDGLRNERENPAVVADTQYAPVPITQAEADAYALKTFGTSEERIARLIEEHNRRS